MTVEKTLHGPTTVSRADTVKANPAAPPDEYLIPENAKAAPAVSDLYENFNVRPNGWTDIVTLTFTFSRPVRNPRLHIAGTGGSAGYEGDREDYWSGLRLSGGEPSTPTFSKVAGFPGFEVTDSEIVPADVIPGLEPTCGVIYMCGTAQVNGTLTSFSVDLRARNVRLTGPAGDPFMWGVFRVTLEEDDSDAPGSYGAASHAVSDLRIGDAVTADNQQTVSFAPRRTDGSDNGEPAQWLRDDAFQRVTPGRRIRLRVPVDSPSAATLAGWVDFDRDGHFDRGELARTGVGERDRGAALTWDVPRGARSGQTWLRLRLAHDARQVTQPKGWAATGEVEDHQIALDVRNAPKRAYRHRHYRKL
ncbi:GEVED domain-containing protein [Nonomuraea sediminis]|uniref:GEVED domain-containing protein n=1 Tax=Nonomuraea sediminis TaxID=2835864 RepID=UPI001BDC145E|nr:GEVED domain-containing protein [Nonomuraea sediminis]